MNKTALLLGVAFCGLSVVLGAFGAHGLKDKLSDYSISVFNKGVMYQFFHGIFLCSRYNFHKYNLV